MGELIWHLGWTLGALCTQKGCRGRREELLPAHRVNGQAQKQDSKGMAEATGSRLSLYMEQERGELSKPNEGGLGHMWNIC